MSDVYSVYVKLFSLWGVLDKATAEFIEQVDGVFSMDAIVHICLCFTYFSYLYTVLFSSVSGLLRNRHIGVQVELWNSVSSMPEGFDGASYNQVSKYRNVLVVLWSLEVFIQ